MKTINDYIREAEAVPRTPENFVAGLRQLGMRAAVPAPDAARLQGQDKSNQFVVNDSGEEWSAPSLLNDPAPDNIDFLDQLKQLPWDQRSWDQGLEVKGVGQDPLPLLNDQGVNVGFFEELNQLELNQQQGSSSALSGVTFRAFSNPIGELQERPMEPSGAKRARVEVPPGVRLPGARSPKVRKLGLG